MGKTAGEHYVENPSDTQGAIAHTATGTIRERPQVKPRDIFYVSDAKRKEYGIKDHEDVYWARDPKVWAQYEHNDRVAELSSPVEDGGMDGRLVTTSELDEIHIGAHGDLVLMAIPKDVMAWRQEDIDDASKKYEASMVQTDAGYEMAHEEERIDRADIIRAKSQLRQQSDYFAMTGLAGGSSPTAGMSLLEAEAHMKRIGFDVKGRQEMLRAGGHHTTPSDEDFTAMITGQQAQARVRDRQAARTHAVGNTGLGKTTQQKVAESRRR